jgi:ribosomal protein L28
MAVKLTARKPLTGNYRSHACNATKRRQNLNLQTKKVNGVKITLTNKEWKTLEKNA